MVFVTVGTQSNAKLEDFRLYRKKMKVFPRLYNRSQRRKEQQPSGNPRRILNLLWFYPVSKVYPRFFVAAYNNKAYTLFSNLTERLGHTWFDLKTSLNQACKMASFIRFLANAAKCISMKQRERCMKG